MTLGSRMRGVLPGFAILMIVALSGCHAMPLDRIDGGPKRPQSLASALLPATLALEPPSEMSSIEPVTPPPGNLTPASEIASAPTPLLDAALQKAQAIDIPPLPVPTTPPKPAEPSTPPPSSLFTAPLPIELPSVSNSNSKPEPASSTSTAEVPPSEPEPVKPEDLWRDGVRKLNSLAHARVEQSGGNASPSPWGLRSKVLSWLAEPDINPDVDSRDLDGVRAVLKALDEPPIDPSRQGDTVRSAVLVLEDRAPLEIVDLKLCSKVEKFGDFEAIEPPVRKAGQRVALYCEVDGLRFEQAGAGFRTRLAAQLEIVPAAGGGPVHAQPLGTAVETCRKRRRDYYVGYLVDLPATLPPGDYRIKLSVKDLTSDRSASRDVAFFIVKD